MNSISILLKSGAAFLLLSFAAACSGGGSSSDRPEVLSTIPDSAATDVPINASISATFDTEMDPDTINDLTFTVTLGAAATPVLGTVLYADMVATFWPEEHLSNFGTYTATITSDAQSLGGTGMGTDYVWQFDTDNSLAPGMPVELGMAGNYAILAKAGISTVPASSMVTGDMGVSPIFATAVTDFSLTMDASGQFSTSAQVIGNVYAADYAPPTSENLTTAVLDMEHAFTDAAARAPDVTELLAGSFTIPQTLAPGVYKWGTSLTITADVTLDGSSSDVWIFQIAQDLIVGSGVEIGLAGFALPENVFFQVSGLVDLDTTSTVNGIILTATSIAVKTNGTVNGRLLAQTAVTLDTATITEPGP